MANHLQRIQEHHYAIIELCLDGHTIGEIARITDMTTAQISNIVNTPMVQSEIARRRANREKMIDDAHAVKRQVAVGIIHDNIEKAAKAQVALLDSQDERVKQTAVSEIFDLAFNHKKAEVSSVRNQQVNINIGNDALNRLDAVLKEIGIDDSQLTVGEEESTEVNTQADAA